MGSIYFKRDRKGRKVYYVDYRVKGVRRREKVGYRLGEAEEALASRMTDIRREKFDGILPELQCTLSEVWNRYSEHSRSTKSAQQVEREKGICEKHLIPSFGGIPLNRITVDQVEAYQARRKDEKRAASTINKEVQLLKNIAKKAAEWRRLRGYQFAGVKPFKEPEGRVRFIDQDEQFDKLVAAMPVWLRPMVIISAYSGVRQGEVRTLKKHNIDKKRRQITLERTKNRSRRVIPMNRTVHDTVCSVPPRLDAEYLFADKEGKPFTRHKVSMAFKRACEKAGVQDFCFHDLRHHFASRLTMKGVNQKTLMELLGHKRPEMTVRYQHLSPNYLKGAVELLDEKNSGDNQLKKQGT